jgi:hypothetical protein
MGGPYKRRQCGLSRQFAARIIWTHEQSTETILAEKVTSEADLAKRRELGATFAVGLSLGVF